MKYLFKFTTVLLVSFSIILAGCGDRSDQTNEPGKTNNQGEQVETENTQDIQPETIKIDESLYEGEELELIKLINSSVQFRNEGNEEEYKKLLSSNSPITTLNKNEVSSIELLSIGDISDTQATVETNVTSEGLTSSTIYVLAKENVGWRILDID